MKLKTDLVSGTVVFGTLPVKGVSMLLGMICQVEKYFLSLLFPIVPAQKLSLKKTKTVSCLCSHEVYDYKSLVWSYSDDNKESDGVPSLCLEDSFMTKLDEMDHLPSWGETKSTKQGPASDHMFSCNGDVDHISHDKLVMEQ